MFGRGYLLRQRVAHSYYKQVLVVYDLTPLIPLSFQERGKLFSEEGLEPLLDTRETLPKFPVIMPLEER